MRESGNYRHCDNINVGAVTVVGSSVLSQMRRILSAIMRKLIVSYANVAPPDVPVRIVSTHAYCMCVCRVCGRNYQHSSSVKAIRFDSVSASFK